MEDRPPAKHIRNGILQLLTAHIRWKRDGMMGCEFVSRLYGPVFEHIARQASAQP